MVKIPKAGGAVELRAAVATCRAAFLGVGVFSGLINLLALTSSIYMLQLYDRVIPSHSVPTLVGLTILMLLLFACYGILDTVRARVMSHIGLRIDRTLRARVFELVLLLPLRGRNSDGLQPVRDLDQVRGFLGGAGPIALFDLPWIPFYLGLVFLLHPWLGLLGTVGAVTLIGLTMLTEMRSRGPTRSASTSVAARLSFGEATRRNAEAIRALGMGPHISAIWSTHNEKYLTDQIGASDVAVTYGSLSKVLRLILQSAVLGLGAYLVIVGQTTGGVMIAASILVSRALAPIEIAIANWRGFLASRQSAERLSKLLQSLPVRPEAIELPKPARSFAVDGLWIAAPGDQKPIVQNASFSLQAGDGLGVIGPSASGKSTLARALVGAWLPLRGTVRLDGAALDQWHHAALGPHIGYLPQDIELLDGSVAQNIARFDKNAPASAVITAAQKAGAHEMVLQLPDGYETRIGDGGTALSAGQRQRVALARALYGDPFLVVLDEPNSNLDTDGDAALTRAIGSVGQRGGIAIVITHRPSALSGLDQLLVMSGGQVQAFGSKEEVLRKAVQMPAATQSTAGRLKIVTEGGAG
jgi:ATP-binding cassette, subfamily C, type I secretion system permease/ATPase